MVLLIKCDLVFRENAILTKEMLGQMNNEPKWLIFDAISNISCGIISGFEFVDEGMDYYSVITKGNIIIEGKWYRLAEDYILKPNNLESGQQYDIILVADKECYDIAIVESGSKADAIKLAGFKYEFSGHKRAFRIPKELADFRRGEAYLKEVAIPYYNFNGKCICAKHIANCIKESLAKVQNKSVKQEIIYQMLITTGTVAIESLCDMVEIKREEVVSETLIEKLLKTIGNYKVHESDTKLKDCEAAEAQEIPNRSMQRKRSRRMGQRRDNT